LSVPRDLKEQFTKLAYDFGTNPTNLIRMFMSQTIATRQINLKLDAPFKNVEIEPLDTSDWGEEFNRKTEENTQKLRTLLAKKRE
jgi:antitoxin component of RelBE/YafQ-DinJ toxin-antitoxin module